MSESIFADDLAKRLVTLLEDARLRKRLGDAGRLYSSAFTRAKVAVQFEGYVKRAVCG